MTNWLDQSCRNYYLLPSTSLETAGSEGLSCTGWGRLVAWHSGAVSSSAEPLATGCRHARRGPLVV